jgi:hypothetical protein
MDALRAAGGARISRPFALCFHETGKGVVAAAVVASAAEKKSISSVRDPDRFPWAFEVKEVRSFFDDPVVVDARLRSGLDTFAGRDPKGAWAWWVQSTRYLTEHDFALLAKIDLIEDLAWGVSDEYRFRRSGVSRWLMQAVRTRCQLVPANASNT